ncbi:hypothetical protein ACWEGT_40245, partial [Amycolatopsis japonica]
MSETTYTAVATSTAEGRNGGRATSDDGVLDVGLAVPKAFGGSGDGTNPEQLFAAGWASCFVGHGGGDRARPGGDRTGGLGHRPRARWRQERRR